MHVAAVVVVDDVNVHPNATQSNLDFTVEHVHFSEAVTEWTLNGVIIIKKTKKKWIFIY